MPTPPREPAVRIPVNLNLIQGVRLAHAIAECGFTVVVPESSLAALQPLSKHFQCRFVADTTSPIAILRHASIDHARPRTIVGGIDRPLIFPRGLAEYCRSMQQESPQHDFTFCGHLTPSRHRCLTRWAARHSPTQSWSTGMSRAVRAVTHLLHKTGLSSRAHTHYIPPLTVIQSPRGRLAHLKYFDPQYLQTLAHSRYTLCPDGDFVWTYRFFEAALCGSIPIVEHHAPCYRGFRYITMDDAIPDECWRRDSVAFNRDRCADLICVAPDQLTDAVASQLTRS